MSNVVERAMDLLGEKGLAKRDGRIAFQKLALLIQVSEGTQTYRFLWGLFGPYSATLAEDMHERLAQRLECGPSPKSDKFLLEVQKTIGADPKLTPYESLEILASYAYVKNSLNLPGEKGVIFLETDPRKRAFLDKLVPEGSPDDKAKKLESALVPLAELVKNSVVGV